MVHTPIIPNRHIIHALPLVPHLQIVVLHNQLNKPIQKVLALLLAQAMNALHVVADGEDGLPARDRVGADDGVHGVERLADVFGGAARRRVDGEVVALSGVGE